MFKLHLKLHQTITILQYASHLSSSSNQEDEMTDILVKIEADFMNYIIIILFKTHISLSVRP